MFTVLFLRLAQLTIVYGDYYYEISHERKTVRLPLRGTRGEIFDRYGLPFAQNSQVFSIHLNRRNLPVGHSRINNMLMEFFEILESSGELHTAVINIPIVLDDSGTASYVWEDQEPEIQAARFERWRSRASIDLPFPADEMIDNLRERYRIDPTWTDEQALRIISIRLDVFKNRFSPNLVSIAVDIGHSTISKIEMQLGDLPGIQTVVETQRVYPFGEVAAHIIGHVGRIDDNMLDLFLQKGYNPSTDRVGVTGIESFAEEQLTASITERHGEMLAEVDARGRVIRVFDKTPARDGKDVILTLDRLLQQSVEDILRREIAAMSSLEPPFPYNQENRLAPLARQGAAVIIDVNNGDILTMASYPSFDLNWYIPNLTTERETQINEDRSLTATAFRERYAPGSIFKMFVGLVGLMEGKISTDEKIVCRDVFIRHGWNAEEAPQCWADFGHGPLNLSDAIKVSCNYFFYEVADRVGIDNLNKWADKINLNEITEIDGITEVESFVGSADRKAIEHRANITNGIRTLLNRHIPEFRNEAPETRQMLVDRLADLPFSVPLSEIRNIISVDKGYLSSREERDTLVRLAERISFDILRLYKRWIPIDTVLTGTGQSYVRFTALSAARFAAMLANGGRVIQPSLIKGYVLEDASIEYAENQQIMEQVFPTEYIEVIKQGMHRSVYDNTFTGQSRGTAVTTFEGLDETITLAGKTGTAQTFAGRPERNTAWFIAFAPFENPEVAIAVMIPKGTASSNAAHVARIIIEEYHRLSNYREQFQTIGESNILNNR